MTEYATSKDGTRIAYDRYGEGPGVILVGGAMQFRAVDLTTSEMASKLADRGFTVINYDRRGRGESAGATSFTLQDEIDDIAALLFIIGGKAALYGSSSGGAIVLAAAAAGLPVTKLALWEVPLGKENGTDATETLTGLKQRISSGNHVSVIEYFMDGMPPEWLNPMLQNPLIVAIAPSLAADSEALAWTQSASRSKLWGGISQPTIAILGEETLPIMPAAVDEILAALPNAHKKVIRASGHGWESDVMVEVLSTFLQDQR